MCRCSSCGTWCIGATAWVSAWFWLFLVQVPCLSVVMSWLFNNTRHSTLAAIVFHFSANFAFALGNGTDRTNACATLLWLAVAVVVALRLPAARDPGEATVRGSRP